MTEKYACGVCGLEYNTWRGGYFSARPCESQGEPKFEYDVGDTVPLDDGCGESHLLKIIDRLVAGRIHFKVYIAENPHKPDQFIAYPESMFNVSIPGNQPIKNKDKVRPIFTEPRISPNWFPCVVADTISAKPQNLK